MELSPVVPFPRPLKGHSEHMFYGDPPEERDTYCAHELHRPSPERFEKYLRRLFRKKTGGAYTLPAIPKNKDYIDIAVIYIQDGMGGGEMDCSQVDSFTFILLDPQPACVIHWDNVLCEVKIHNLR